jgi:hypothetical protein
LAIEFQMGYQRALLLDLFKSLEEEDKAGHHQAAMSGTDLACQRFQELWQRRLEQMEALGKSNHVTLMAVLPLDHLFDNTRTYAELVSP